MTTKGQDPRHEPEVRAALALNRAMHEAAHVAAALCERSAGFPAPATGSPEKGEAT